MSIKFTDDNFDEEVLKSSIPVLVDFYADWCGPCKMIAPVIDEIASEYTGKIKVGKLNVDESPKRIADYRIMNIPTIMLFKSGEPVDKIVGGVVKSEIVSMIERNI